jgi:hypothetical protein
MIKSRRSIAYKAKGITLCASRVDVDAVQMRQISVPAENQALFPGQSDCRSAQKFVSKTQDV